MTLAALETIKGRCPRPSPSGLPGGRVGDTVGVDSGHAGLFRGAEVVLFLERAAGLRGSYRLTEFGISKFDLVADDEGGASPSRPAFGPRTTSSRPSAADIAAGLAPKSAIPARDAESFLAALSAIARAASRARSCGARCVAEGAASTRPKWVNIGGREPGDCGARPLPLALVLGHGASSNGVVPVTGTQTNLTTDDAAGCGTDSLCDVQNGVDSGAASHGPTCA